ncbi:MAG TPA: S8 family serine peptidase [Pyrinomonadaceae bacterium]|jgi:subtilisin family serine protease|nr:S8 family serine peptidase [Pyrinomonadaceae bacterium]
MIQSLPFTFPSSTPPPEEIHGYISIKGEASVFTDGLSGWPDSSKPFEAKRAAQNEARRNLEKAGFIVIAESPLGVSVVGPPEAYEEISGGRVETVERLTIAEGSQARYVTNIDIVGDKQPETLGVAQPKSKATKIDGIVIERPKVPYARPRGVFPSPIPPNSPRFHLRVPNDVSVGLGASNAHREGFNGDGVNVAMVDTGQFSHPYFLAHRYRVRRAIAMVPGTDPSKDPVSHGTGESANIFAVAPGAVLQPIRASNKNGALVAALSGFIKAKELKPAILTNSWGGDGPFPPPGGPDEADLAMAAEIQHAIESGILVVFSAGNGHFSIEPQVPGVLAAGGVFMSPDLALQASDYASGYKSPWFPNVTVPTVCGLVGMLPRAQYIMLPVQPGSELDVEQSRPDLPDDPEGDGTTAGDGWALFSGTSAAAPQLAGVAALILGAKPGLKPAQVIEAMSRTATDVRAGRCHPRFNNLARAGHDDATGSGIVNASAAVRFALENF